jgi:hypothetical protein
MKKTAQKFVHYAFLTVLYSIGTATAGLIVYTIIVALNTTY